MTKWSRRARQAKTAARAKAPKQPEGKNQMMAAWGRLGGSARTAKLSPEQRREIARRAAAARWNRPLQADVLLEPNQPAPMDQIAEAARLILRLVGGHHGNNP